MDEGAYQPTPMEAPIMGTAFPDLGLIERHYKSRRDGMTRQKSYLGAEETANFAMMPHELMIGLKDQKCNYTNSPSAQLGFTSVAGMHYGDADVEILMRQYYFIGVPTDEWFYKGESMYNTDSLDHGIGVLLSGKTTIINLSDEDVTPGDWLAWRFPATRSGDPGPRKYRVGHSIDTGINPLVSRNRAGTPFSKPLIELEKFNPLDFTFQLSGAFWTLSKDVEVGGIKNMQMEDYLADPNQFTTIQQEAFCWSRGLLSVIMSSKKTAVKQEAFAIRMGLIGAKEEVTPAAFDLLKNIFRRNTVPGDNPTYDKTGGSWDSNSNKVAYLLDNMMTHLTGGVSGGLMSKLGRVIGKAASSAGPSKSLDMLLIGARLGI